MTADSNVHEIVVPFTNLKKNTTEPTLNDFNFSQGRKLTLTTKIDGKDFDENKNQACFVVSPWFDLERQLLKTEKGFEVRDTMELKQEPSNADIQNNKEYKYFLKDLALCAQTQKVRLTKMDPKRNLTQRLEDYTLENIKALRDLPEKAAIKTAFKRKMIVDQLLQKTPANKELLIERVQALRMLGLRHEESLSPTLLSAINLNLDKILTQDPNFIPALIQKSYTLEGMNQLEQARTYFLKAYAFEKARSHEVYILGGWLSKKMKQLNIALQFYALSLSKAKSNHEKNLSYKRLGYISDDLREQKKAVDYFLHALRYVPTDTTLMEDLVSLLVDTNRFDEAIKIGEKLLTLEPSQQTRLNLADAYAGRAEQLLTGPLTAETAQKVRSLALQGLKLDAKNKRCNLALARSNQNVAQTNHTPSSKRRPASSPKDQHR